MAEKTLRELLAPDFEEHRICIAFSDDVEPFEFKASLMHALPKYYGKENEDPYKHLMDHHLACETQRVQNVTSDDMKLRTFAYTLDDKAKNWFYSLPAGSITTWKAMRAKFIDRFFPESWVTNIRKEIRGIRQETGESLFDYWERFMTLIESCPYHQFSEQMLIQYFYDGLGTWERGFIEVARAGAFMNQNQTMEAAKMLIETRENNGRHYGYRGREVQAANGANSSDIDGRLDRLTALVEKFAMENMQQVKACGICSKVGHPTDSCSTLQEESYVNLVDGFQGQQRGYDPYSNTYNPGWMDHPNFSYKQPGTQEQIQPQPPAAPSLEDILSKTLTLQQSFQQETRKVQQGLQQEIQKIQQDVQNEVRNMRHEIRDLQNESRTGLRNLEMQMSQLASSVSQLQAFNRTKGNYHH